MQGLSTVSETIQALENALTGHGIFIYARIDQRAEAVKAGLTIKPMTLLIFGNPGAGIPLMIANPICGLDLPLKILCWEDNDQKTWLSYNSFTYLQKRFGLPDELIQNILKVEKIIREVVKA